MAVAVVTGASRGLGLALARGLAERGWSLVLDARKAPALEAAADGLRALGARVAALPGDVADPAHRAALLTAAEALGGVELLVNNAGVLGAEPLVRLAEQPPEGFRQALEVNVVAPLALTQAALPALRRAHGAVLNISSDAAVVPYPTWGGYGATKAALEQLSAVLAEEEPEVRVWWADPGELRTATYAAAVPDDDMAGRTDPAEVAPALLSLLERRAVSGRYTAAELATAVRS
jgi:short-subunit dehydrogenase